MKLAKRFAPTIVIFVATCLFLSVSTVRVLLFHIPEEAGHDTTSCHIDILNFPFTQELQRYLNSTWQTFAS